MQKKFLRFGRGFRVALTGTRAQAAEMVLVPGDSEGGPENRHRATDQWLFVVSGGGVAIVNGRQHRLRPGMLLLIERGDEHEIRNTGRTALRTLNLYVPPGYTRGGQPLPRARAAFIG